MKRVSILCLIICVAAAAALSAGQHRSVPLDHRVYQVIRSAEIRGAVAPQMSVKPYSASFVVALLDQMIHKPELFSPAELGEINSLRSSLVPEYGTESFSQMIREGSYHGYDEDRGFGVAIGAEMESQLAYSVASGAYDFRSAVRPYIDGDFLDFASFHMDASIRLDRLNNRLWPSHDFTIPGEGFYFTFAFDDPTKSVVYMDEIPAERFYFGFDMFPEISFSLRDGAVQFRWGMLHRNWGVGHNSLQLAGSARTFDGFEGYLEFGDWLRYTFLTGSLGTFSLTEIDGEPFFSDSRLAKDDSNFHNMFSMKRVELNLPMNFIFGIYESCVWQKRFEIGYINPFAVLMLQQNLLGDYDNMLAGVDLQWYLPGGLRLHGSWATTEMHHPNPLVWFSEARNILGVQGGIDVPLPVGLFSLLSVQYTRLEPFFYSHYRHEDEEQLHPIYRGGDNELETAYVNKGENLGYPLHPNSDELLVRASGGILPGLDGMVTLKYQRRSGQYGYRIDMPMNYSDYRKGLYPEKDFAANVMERTLSIETGVSKQLQKLPIKLFASYRYVHTLSRERISDDTDYEPSFGPWEDPVRDHIIKVGVNLFR